VILDTLTIPIQLVGSTKPHYLATLSDRLQAAHAKYRSQQRFPPNMCNPLSNQTCKEHDRLSFWRPPGSNLQMKPWMYSVMDLNHTSSTRGLTKLNKCCPATTKTTTFLLALNLRLMLKHRQASTKHAPPASTPLCGLHGSRRPPSNSKATNNEPIKSYFILLFLLQHFCGALGWCQLHPVSEQGGQH